MRLQIPMPDASRNREGHNQGKGRREAGFAWDSPASLRCRCKWSPQLSPGTTLFVDVPAEIVREVLQCALKWLYCSRSKGAEGVSRSKEFRLEGESIEITGAPS